MDTLDCCTVDLQEYVASVLKSPNRHVGIESLHSANEVNPARLVGGVEEIRYPAVHDPIVVARDFDRRCGSISSSRRGGTFEVRQPKRAVND